MDQFTTKPVAEQATRIEIAVASTWSGVAERFLDGADVVAVFQQMGSKVVAQGLAVNPFDHAAVGMAGPSVGHHVYEEPAFSRLTNILPRAKHCAGWECQGRSEEDGGCIADIPDLAACSAFGETPEEALREVQLAKALWLKAARAESKPIPPISPCLCSCLIA